MTTLKADTRYANARGAHSVPIEPENSIEGYVPLPPEYPAHGAAVMVVEGDVIVQLDLGFTLRELGATCVVTVTTGAQGLSALDTHHFDCALLDAGIGQRMILDIGERLVSCRVPFALTNSYGAGLILPTPFEAIPILAKPFTQAMLERLIATLLSPGCGMPKRI